MSPESDRAASGRGQPTMKHVAARAGVGITTVSRVVNGDPHVSEATIEAVRRAIDELGYRRNESARQFRTGTTETVGLVIEDVTDPFFSQLTQSVEDVARSRGSMLLVASYRRERELARRIIHSLSARQLQGIIVTPTEGGDDPIYEDELRTGLRMVFVDRPAPDEIADAVLTDNRSGSRTGVAHLIAHGHRRIACLSDRGELYTSRERIAGYRDALAAAGIRFDPSLVHSALPGPASHAPAVSRMLAGDDPPTALFTCNNRTSTSILSELTPAMRDLAMLGFDDLELAASLSPGLSVISQNPSTMGRLATEQLFERIDGYEGPSRTTMLSAELIPRGSGERAPAR